MKVQRSQSVGFGNVVSETAKPVKKVLAEQLAAYQGYSASFRTASSRKGPVLLVDVLYNGKKTTEPVLVKLNGNKKDPDVAEIAAKKVMSRVIADSKARIMFDQMA